LNEVMTLEGAGDRKGKRHPLRRTPKVIHRAGRQKSRRINWERVKESLKGRIGKAPIGKDGSRRTPEREHERRIDQDF